MRRLTVALALLLLAAPSWASFRADASTVTWFSQLPTASMTKYRDALLWYYGLQPLNGLLATSAISNVVLTDLGGGNSELAITMPLGAGNTWVATLAAPACPSANTTALRRTCVDPLIKADFKRVWELYDAYLRNIASPPVAPPDL